jgi:ComF family protein
VRFLTIANLLYPPACLLCEAGLPDASASCVLCSGCRAAMPESRAPLCTACGIEISGAFDASARCAGCLRRAPAFDRACAPWRYEGPARDAVREFKYRRRWRLGRWLAGTMAACARRSLPVDEIDVVAPVPLHWATGRLRGFQATDLLARAVAGALEKPARLRALRRRRWTASQTRLPWAARSRNVRSAFRADPEAVRGRRVLLVDDVLTSGATAGACASALRDAGASRVFVLTAARTSRERP